MNDFVRMRFLRWSIGMFIGSLAMALIVATLNTRFEFETRTRVELGAAAEAFRPEILGGETRDVERQVHRLFNLKESETVSVLDQNLNDVFPDASKVDLWTQHLSDKTLVWLTPFRLVSAIPIFFDQDHRRLFGYLAVDRTARFNLTSFFLVFCSLLISQALFTVFFRREILSLGEKVSDELTSIMNLISDDHKPSLSTDSAAKLHDISEIQNVRTAVAKIQTTSESLEKRGETHRQTLRQVAHDIRSPLTAMSVGLRYLEGVSPEARSLLEGAFGRVQAIAGDLLAPQVQPLPNLSAEPTPAIGQTKLHELEILIIRLLEEKKLERANSQIVLDSDILDNDPFFALPFNVSAAKLLRCISNLLNNAIEASPANSEIQLRLRLNSGLVIEIEDRGKGIRDQLRDRILQGRYTSKINGNGLGVSSAFAFAQSIGGSFTMQNASPGLVVRLALPLQPI